MQSSQPFDPNRKIIDSLNHQHAPRSRTRKNQNDHNGGEKKSRPETQQQTKKEHKIPVMPNVLLDKERNVEYFVNVSEDLLGRGGFAWCWKGFDPSAAQQVAIKVIPHSGLTKPYQLDKVEREIRIHKKARHPNVVHLLSSFEDESNIYLVMEHCARNTLMHVMASRITYTEPEVRFILREIVSGVRYLHETLRVLHRDLKLGNVLFTEDMQVKICDFGLAAAMNSDGLSKLVSVCGTPNYIAPEVLDRKGHSTASDSWAIGCMLFCLLVGTPPFNSDSLDETYRRIKAQEYSFPNTVEISESARDLIKLYLDPDPDKRPSSSSVVCHEFLRPELVPERLDPSFCFLRPTQFDINRLLPRPRPTVLCPNFSFSNGRPRSQSSDWESGSKGSLTPDSGLGSESPFSCTKSPSPYPPLLAAASSSSRRNGRGTPYPSSLRRRPELSGRQWHQKWIQGLVDAFRNPLEARICVTRTDNLFRIDSDLLVTKWMETSKPQNTVGCELRNGSVCLMFWDGCGLSLDPRGYTFQFTDTSGLPGVRYSAFDAAPDWLRPKLEALEEFRRLFGTRYKELSSPKIPSLCGWFREGSSVLLALEQDGEFSVQTLMYSGPEKSGRSVKFVLSPQNRSLPLFRLTQTDFEGVSESYLLEVGSADGSPQDLFKLKDPIAFIDFVRALPKLSYSY